MGSSGAYCTLNLLGTVEAFFAYILPSDRDTNLQRACFTQRNY